MNETEVRELIGGITYRPRYTLTVQRDKKDPEGRLYLQLAVERPDCFTGEMGTGRSGKTYLSEHQTVSEIVRKCFQLFSNYEEHECREDFRWNGRAIFGPHIDIKALWDVSSEIDVRI